MKYRINEKFISINGEGERAGELAVFIRLAGCPLRCTYCDTGYALSADSPHELLDEDEIMEYVSSAGIRNVTLTGGEPLAAENIGILISRLCGEGLRTEIETSGCIDINEFRVISPSPVFTVDYKLPSSGMERFMLPENYKHLSGDDTVKFVCGTDEDLERAFAVMDEYSLIGRCHVHLSPVFGRMEPERIVRFMTERKLNGVRLQLQLHKFIWNPDKRGV